MFVSFTVEYDIDLFYEMDKGRVKHFIEYDEAVKFIHALGSNRYKNIKLYRHTYNKEVMPWPSH